MIASRLVRLAALLALCVALPALAQNAPAFFIETITVEGASSARIVVAESRLREGQIYGEPELRDAMARIQRLPFVLWTDFRLAKGSAVEKYVLVISIKQMKPLFLNVGMLTRWTPLDVFERRPEGLVKVGEVIDQARGTELAGGGRMFLGSRGVLTAAAQVVEDREDRYILAFTQYDLFGTRASITALVSELDDPGAMRPPGPDARIDWRRRDNFLYELIGVVPIGNNDSIRGTWQRSERPIRYFELSPETGSPRGVLRSLPEIRKELFWIHDTTNDPLFPTSGTRITAGVIRTSMPTSGFTELGRVKVDEYRTTLERSWTVTPQQSLTLGASGLDFDRSIKKYRGYARYAFDLWGRERTLKYGDLRLELQADRVFTKVRQFPFDAESTARIGLAHRNVWGVLRLDFEYNAWREP